MEPPCSRRSFLLSASAASGALLGAQAASTDLKAQGPNTEQTGLRVTNQPNNEPLAIASANGLCSVKIAYDLVLKGADPLDAAIDAVVPVEEDPNDTSVGYGGLPNEDGVVELDAAVMHGPTHRAGAVAALRNIKTPSRVAKLVIEQTDHCLLVGDGALKFARDHGFTETNLLTDKARKIWLYWKANLSDHDDRLPDPNAADDPDIKEFLRHHGTIHCSVRTARGDLAGVTSTSGLSFKLPGRVGDSPIVGAGLYVDNDVAACGSTGRGEAVILSAGSFAVVEQLRRGAAPQEACLAVLKRIADQARRAGLVRKDGRPNFDVKLYTVTKDGRYASAAIFRGAKFSLCDSRGARHEDCAYLFDR